MIDEDPEYQTIDETYPLSGSLTQNSSYPTENYSSASMPSLKQQVVHGVTTKHMPSSSSYHLFPTSINTSLEQPLPVDRKLKKHHHHLSESNRPAKMSISTLSSSSALPAMPSTSDTFSQHYQLSHSCLLPLGTAYNPTSMLIPPPPNFRNSAAFDESDLSLETKPIQSPCQPKRPKTKCSQKRKNYRNKITTQAIINYSHEEDPNPPGNQFAVMPFSSADNLPGRPLTSKRWYSR